MLQRAAIYTYNQERQEDPLIVSWTCCSNSLGENKAAGEDFYMMGAPFTTIQEMGH